MGPTNLDQPNHSFMPGLGKRDNINVKADEVDYMKGDGNYTHVHLIVGRPILFSRTLSTFANTPGFIRVHKGYLVNIDHINRIRVNGPKEACVILRSGVEIPISRRRATFVAQQIRHSRKG